MIDRTLNHARKLREQETPAEQRLWRHLRNRQLCGWKFRRQAPIDPYIVDFLCFEAGLIVEVDGATHSTDEELSYDAARTAFLDRKGFAVFRITNDDLRNDADMVLHAIAAACQQALTRRSAS